MESSNLIISSDRYDSALVKNLFSSEIKDRFQKLLDAECKESGNMSRAQAAMALGLSPVFKLLPKKEEQDLRSRCERDFKMTCEKLSIPYDKKKLKILSDKLPPDVDQEFSKAKTTLKFDEYDSYRRLRAPLLEMEAILGLMVSRGIVQGYSMTKGPGGGITSKKRTAVSKNVKNNYPDGFLEALMTALDKLLPIRNANQPIVCVARTQITKEMGVKWLGSDYEGKISAAIRNKDILGFDSRTGVKGGVYRLSSEEMSKSESSTQEEFSDEEDNDFDDSFEEEDSE